MSSSDEFDNTITLYDEDGNEIEFDIIEQMSFQGKEYFLLWGEDDEEEDVYVVVTETNGEYVVVTDDNILERMDKKFKSGMAELESVTNGDTSVDDYIE